MDEAYVVLVCDAGSGAYQAFPFATKHAAEVAREWFADRGSSTRTLLVDDHDPPEDITLDECAAADLERERIAAGMK